MSLGGILILVLLVISLFLFIYLIVITAKSWGILQTILLCFLFIECWVFLFFTAQVADKRLAMLKDYSTTLATVEKTRKEVHTLTWGGDNIAEEQEAFVPLAGMVHRLAADRGRVWRNVNKLTVEGELVRLELNAPTQVPPAADDPTAVPAPAAPAAANQGATLPVNMIVYAFTQGVPDATAAIPPTSPSQPAADASASDAAATDVAASDAASPTDAQSTPDPAATAAGGETPASGNGIAVPRVYLGEFTVVESTPGNIAIKPMAPLEANQVQARDTESTWVLYEALPQDSHEAFFVKGAESTDEAVFGKPDQSSLNQLFAAVPAERRAAVMEAYTRDGTAAKETDPLANVWVLVEVVTPLKREVNGASANATTGAYFDTSGRAIDSRLMAEGETREVTVPEGKQMLLPLTEVGDNNVNEVSKLIADGAVKVIRRLYVRPLNAYEKGMSQLRIRREEVNRQIDLARREYDILQQANDLTQSTRGAYVELNQKLVSDRDSYRREQEVLDKEIAAVTTQYQAARTQMLQFWNAIHAAHDKMVAP